MKKYIADVVMTTQYCYWLALEVITLYKPQTVYEHSEN